jgi:hypothetical protein
VRVRVKSFAVVAVGAEEEDAAMVKRFQRAMKIAQHQLLMRVNLVRV